MATPSLPALSAYRQILRATRVAFANDSRVLLAARAEARRNFDQNRRVGVDTGMQINQAIEVASILRHNIVQGSREDGNEDAKWELNIHDQIERGDNDTIKVGNKDVKIHKACSS
ncbi:Mitochondrial zinc maintenance protein 1 [Penicillium cinerascens]|uniref:Mitochondrial zinc maintenance protein 1, mitochondrial n=1 Tax=Penicillium cinerascens TaxID=70096 RepID=A0A9W9JKF3_9EURO|nr:Mitochondrial zinc maintenance protein 1 [Penicillium cinerascens]KAJ5198543.1 Mitochondrial zinc maintenance protein 1 [Penicillium cinerascens]